MNIKARARLSKKPPVETPFNYLFQSLSLVFPFRAVLAFLPLGKCEKCQPFCPGVTQQGRWPLSQQGTLMATLSRAKLGLAMPACLFVLQLFGDFP